MSDIRIKPLNETHMKVFFEDDGIAQEFSEFFTFYADGYKYTPKFKSGMWDGKIRLFNNRTNTIYKGLLEYVYKFAENYGYEVDCDQSMQNHVEIDFDEVKEFVDSLNIHTKGQKISVHQYQYEAIYQALSSHRKILISPTSSGKSLIIYCILRWYLAKDDHKIIIVVPTQLLVKQFFSDLMDYSSENGWVTEEMVQLLYAGKSKLFTKNVMISTWQSLMSMMKDQPDMYRDLTAKTTIGIFDEAHQYAAAAVLSTLEKFTDTKYRIGTTGTLDKSKTHELTLTGLLGPTYRVIETHELIEQGAATPVKIEAIVLEYPKEICDLMKNSDYDTEVDFILASEARNKFIRNLAISRKGNTIIMFAFVEKHGEILYNMIKEKVGDTRPVYFIHGKMSEDPEHIRKLINEQEDVIAIASEKMFSTGVNIPNLHHIILAMPRVSANLIQQIIGRGLRLFSGKKVVYFYDISDNLSTKKWTNTGMKHLKARITLYIKKKLPWKMHVIKLGTRDTNST